MKTLFALVAAALSLAPFAAQAEEYSFDVPEKLVVVTFESRMEVEDILGTTRSVQGHVRLDGPERPGGEAGGSFVVEVPVASLKTGIDLRDEHLRSEAWLDGTRFPTIRFEGTTLRKMTDTRYAVSGTFTMHGVARPLALEVDVQRIPSDRATKLGLGEGDWLRVRGELRVKLSDHGVTIPAMTAAKVSDEWTVKVSLFGHSAQTKEAAR